MNLYETTYDLDFKRSSKDPDIEKLNRGFETFLINMGIVYAKCYKKDRAQFKKFFIERKFVQSMCGLIYWAYRLHNLVEEVEGEEGERRERLFARRIVKVFEVIIGEPSTHSNISAAEQNQASK